MGETRNMQSDIPTEAGKRPPFAKPDEPDPASGVGMGDGYSGQEYDGTGQAKWRAEQEKRSLPADGEVRGSGAGAGGGNPGEDYDSDDAAGSGARG